jgi:O-antigen/teichoic acid export membrane protein
MPSLQHLSNELVELMFAIGAPIAVGLFFLGDKALLALYARREFLQAVPMLRVMVWILMVTALTAVLGEVLIACHYEKVRLRIVAVNAITSLVAGLVLITALGLIGAAIALLLTRIVDSYQHYRVASKVLSLPPLAKLIWKPLLAGVLMAAYLWSTNGRTGTVSAIAGAGAVYIVILLILAVWSAGGPRELKAKKLYGWSE